jgi:hypothetical protein
MPERDCRRVVIVGGVAQRAGYATRLLRPHGLEARNLGYATWRTFEEAQAPPAGAGS